MPCRDHATWSRLQVLLQLGRYKRLSARVPKEYYHGSTALKLIDYLKRSDERSREGGLTEPKTKTGLLIEINELKYKPNFPYVSM